MGSKPITRAYSSYSAGDGSEWCSPSVIGDLNNLDLHNAASATLDSVHLPTPSKRNSRTLSAATINESDISMSDLSEDEEPKSARRRGGGPKKKGSGNVFRDDNGRVISREEAKRIRKRKTNRDSARRMRLLRKQQHDNLQQEVQDKSIELQRAIAMNRQISASYEHLQTQFATMEKRDNTILFATVELLSHISQNIGSQLESGALANFLRQIVPYLPSNKYLPLKDELMVKSTKLIPTKHNIHVDATSYEDANLQASPSSPEAEHSPVRLARQTFKKEPLFNQEQSPALIEPVVDNMQDRIELHHGHDLHHGDEMHHSGELHDLQSFVHHMPAPDSLMMPLRPMMSHTDMPIVSLDGATGSGMFRDHIEELLKLPSLEALLDKQTSLEALDIMDFLKDMPN